MSKRARDAADEASESRLSGTCAGGPRDLDDAFKRTLQSDPTGLLDMLYSRWELDTRMASIEDFTRLAMANFGMIADNDVDLGAPQEFGLRKLDETIERHEQEAIAVFNALKQMDPAGQEPMLQLRATKVIEMVYYAKRVVLSAFQARLAVHQLHCADHVLGEDLDLLLGSWTLRFRWIDQTKSTPLQKLLLHLLDTAMEKRYRKHAGFVYEPIVVNGHETHAWRQVCEIKEFVYESTKKEVHWEQWCNLTASGSNAKLAIEHLSSSNDYQFRFLHKDRSVFSFRNGVYVAREDRFYQFGDERGAGLSDSVVAAKFFDAEFDVFSELPGWRDIPTPSLQRIMDYQAWPPDVCDWMYISLGRLLYNVNEKDGWQVIPFLHGMGATGKCFAAGTQLLMFDGSVRCVEDIRPGDRVMGDDSSPRAVLSLARGVDDMFTLQPKSSAYQAVTVTGDHVLCLQYAGGDGATLEMTVKEYLALPACLRQRLVCYRVPFDFVVDEAPAFDPWLVGVWLMEGIARNSTCFGEALQEYGLVDDQSIPNAYKKGSRHTRLELLAGMLDAGGIHSRSGRYTLILKSERLAADVVFVARSLGFGATHTRVMPDNTCHAVSIFGEGLADVPVVTERTRPAPTPADGAAASGRACLQWAFDVVPARRQAYWGFSTDGNRRFLLADGTVTHNSTVALKVAKLFYDHADVGVLSNNIERQFGISAFWDKLLFCGPEIKGDLKVEQAEFQSIVSGESVQISAKHKKAFTVEWTTPGILAGNEVPSFSDNAGSVQRRFLVFSFMKAVLNGDMRLADKLAAEIPAILVKCNRAYLEAASKWGSRNIWTVLPNYFLNTRNEMAQAVNSVEAFLASSDVVLDAELFCPFKEFRDAWKSFSIANGYAHQSKPAIRTFFNTPFEKFGLRFEDGTTRAYRGRNRKAEWVVGVDLAVEESEAILG